MKKESLKNICSKAIQIIKNNISGEGETLIEELEAVISELDNADEVVTLEEVVEKIEEAIKGVETIDEEAIVDKVVANKAFANAIQNILAEEKNKNKSYKMENKTFSKSDVNQACKIIVNSMIERKDIAHELKNGIVGLTTPVEVLQEIISAWKTDDLYNVIRHLGASDTKIQYTDDSQWADATTARQHALGTAKIDQVINVRAKDFLSAMIYKQIGVDKLTLRKITNETEFINNIMQEIYDQIMASITRAILIGDPRANVQLTAAEAITSFESILGADATNDLWRTYKAVGANTDIWNEMKVMANTLLSYAKPGQKVRIYTTLDVYNQLALGPYDNGISLPIGKDMIESILGVEIVFNSGVLEQASFTPGTVNAIGLIVEQYGAVEASPMEAENWIKYERNQYYYRYEIACGGGIMGPGSTYILYTAATPATPATPADPPAGGGDTPTGGGDTPPAGGDAGGDAGDDTPPAGGE